MASSSRNNIDNLTDFMNFINNSLGTSPNISDIPITKTEDEKSLYLYAYIPGVKKEDIVIDMFNNTLTISVNRESSWQDTDVVINEIKMGELSRQITLPLAITRRDSLAANYVDGVLKIEIRKFLEEENRFTMNVS